MSSSKPPADEPVDRVGEASRESFPASDSPAWAMGIEPDPSLDIENDQVNHRFEAHAGGMGNGVIVGAPIHLRAPV